MINRLFHGPLGAIAFGVVGTGLSLILGYRGFAWWSQDAPLFGCLLLWMVIAWFTFDQPSRQERRDRLAATKRRTAEINARTDRINALRADLHAGRDIGDVLAEFIILEAEREADA